MPKRNVYFSETDVTIWDNLPDGGKSQLLRDFLLEQQQSLNRLNITVREKERESLRYQIIASEAESMQLHKQRQEVEQRLKYLNDNLAKKIEEFESKFGAWDHDEN